MIGLTISSQTTGVEPVSVDDLKEHLRIDSTASGGTTAEDALLGLYIETARSQAEEITKRSLIPTQWELRLDSFGASAIELPRGTPLSTTDFEITYTKTTGDSTTVPSTSYVVETWAEPGRVRLDYERSWPEDLQPTEGSVVISYRSGYSTAGTACPEPIKHWIKMRAGQMYEFREPLISGTIVTNLAHDYVDGLLDPYRLPSV